jgi:hypothetical protein
MHELALVFESGMRAFPPRLPEQPIFYPVLDSGYADQIARDWNTKERSYAGYALRMEIDDEYAARYTQQTVGARQHRELWVPAEELDEFNARILGSIHIERAFFGPEFRGHIPEKPSLLRGADAFRQVTILLGVMDYSMFDFVLEVAANQLTFFLNFPFWKAAGAQRLEVDPAQLERCLDVIRRAWSSAARPAPLLEEAVCVTLNP